ncbi:MAG: hypothetical protein ACI4UV_12605 [Victivallales bacterium]
MAVLNEFRSVYSHFAPLAFVVSIKPLYLDCIMKKKFRRNNENTNIFSFFYYQAGVPELRNSGKTQFHLSRLSAEAAADAPPAAFFSNLQ